MVINSIRGQDGTMKIVMHLAYWCLLSWKVGSKCGGLVDINCINHNSSGGILLNEDE